MGKKKISKPNSRYSESFCSKLAMIKEKKLITQTQEVLIKIKEEVEESLGEIMNEFLNDFVARKDKRLASKCPTSQMHTYNLVVNKSYRKKIKKQVCLLINSDFTINLQQSLETQATKFVESLKQCLKELNPMSKILQIIFLYDAYHTLQNASAEIGKIVSGIYKFKRTSTEYFFSKIFFTRIVTHSNELLTQAEDYDKNHFAISGIKKMQCSLSRILASDKYLLELTKNLSETDSDSENTDPEPLYNLPIDDLVTYIEGKNKNNNSRRTAASSISPLHVEYTEMDKEIDEFRKRIDIPITPYRPKLNLSQEFLDQLKKRLIRNKVN